MRIGAHRINTSVVLVILETIMSITPSVAQQTSFRNAPASAADMKNPYTGSATAATAGKKLYAKDCAQCHGNNLQGMGPAPALDTSQFATPKRASCSGLSRPASSTSACLSWSNLPKQQRWQIVTFLESRRTRRLRRNSKAHRGGYGVTNCSQGNSASDCWKAAEIRYNRVVSASNPFLAPKTALITGASSGIGLELAHLFAHDGYRLVLVARNRGALRELGDDLQSRYSVDIRISPKDLAHPASPAELYQELQEAGIVLDVLVNNAGFGGSGSFAQYRLE